MADATTDAILLVLAIIIPLGLFALLFRYLKNTAPGGSVPASVPKPPEPDSPTAKLAGAKKCKRCGVEVRPTSGRIYAKECPNCGSGLNA